MRVRTGEGELVITPQSPDVEITLSRGGKEIPIVDTKTRKRVALPVGSYDVAVKNKPDGIDVTTDRVTVRRGQETLTYCHSVMSQF